jgi:hypothetical protein
MTIARIASTTNKITLMIMVLPMKVQTTTMEK